jgi:hypothetical protein
MKDHPMHGRLNDTHRQHFYTQEDYERSRELKGREKRTTLSRLIDLMKDALPEIEEDQKRETMKKLVDDITNSSIRYIDTRISLVMASGSRNKNAIIEADRARRAAHIRLTDTIRIACRNFVKEVEDWRIEDDMSPIVGASDNRTTREAVANAAIDMVWEMLHAEEASKRGY